MHLDKPLSTSSNDGRTRLVAIMAEVRPELHRYCARLTGSVFEGEDIVQDVFVRALVAVDTLDPEVPLKPWLFRIAHNRSLDYLRSKTVRRSESIDAAQQVADELTPDPVEAFVRQEALDTAISRFTQLPIVQRSVIILKDVLDYSLQEISDLLDLSVNSVKAALSRGRARLKELNSEAPAELRVSKVASVEATRFSSLFNRRDWDALRSMLADDVHVTQTMRADRRGAADAGNFFTIYAGVQEFHLAPAYLSGGYGDEVIAVFAHAGDDRPAYLMKVEWRDSRIVRIRDFRYASYILEGADLVFAAPDNYRGVDSIP